MRSLVRFQLAPHVDFPPGFFDRADPNPDAAFYRPLRLVTHIDDDAIAAVGALYTELGIGVTGDGEVLDLMSSWVSHFEAPPRRLTVLGMNDDELADLAYRHLTVGLGVDVGVGVTGGGVPGVPVGVAVGGGVGVPGGVGRGNGVGRGRGVGVGLGVGVAIPSMVPLSRYT